MKKSFGNFTFLISMLFLIMLACVSGAEPGDTQNNQAAGGTEPAASPVPTTPIPTAIQHEMIPPELPALQTGAVGDQDSSTTASQNRAPSGDRFTFNGFERPFNAGSMDAYYPSIDIQGALFYEDVDWLYAVISLKDDGSGQPLDGKYGFEIDLDVDGRGDWLVLAAEPTSTEWTTAGVEVWFDTDKDVGGSAPAMTDTTLSDGNGFETMVFGKGQGDDHDLAWVRISPQDPYTVQIAVKRAILNGDQVYMVGMWAGHDAFDPSLFDINDRFTHEQAGAALKELKYFYPIKEVSALDNTCRMAIGFQPRGGEPGLCPLPPAAERQPDEPTSCPPQYVVCFNYGKETVCFCNQP